MKFKTVDQIRNEFLIFFQNREHYNLPSFPLVPKNDNSLLLINSGMAPMKAFFTGLEKPPAPRVATCQKCIRTVDIDEVGKDDRHGSFFEMLGNFSFGNYFKKETIHWAWEFLTVNMEIPQDRLLVSVYKDDAEAYDIWTQDIKIPAERMFKLGKDDNYWEHGVGPCGPCSEIHYDRGTQYGCGQPDCTVGCDCDRYMEIWNLVFTQFEKLDNGEYAPLVTTNIDTGMGLERLAIIMQDAASIFEIDNIKAVKGKVLKMASEPNIISANIVSDHVRSAVFLASDGVLPANEGRGYILRRLLRRAVRHGKALGLTGFVGDIAVASIEAYGSAYPVLHEKQSHIVQVLSTEESRFLETLESGTNMLQKMLGNSTALSGADAFKLYDTYGFPPDLTREILEERGMTWDEAGFVQEMDAQKKRARSARAASTYLGADETIYHSLPPSLDTEFVDNLAIEDAKILAFIQPNDETVAIVLDRTPFYATGGGQRGDVGTLTASGIEIEVVECFVAAGNTIHLGNVKKLATPLAEGMTICAEVCNNYRSATMSNHTATHLLQWALRTVVGQHVEQAGSFVSNDRLRFDFTNDAPLTYAQKEEIATMVNAIIWQKVPVSVELTTPEEAREKGAIALFGEKYGDTVRLVSIGDASKELCGGTHVTNTGDIGLFRILSEAGIAAGVRRIEAVTGRNAYMLLTEESATLHNIAATLKVKPDALPEKISALSAEIKALRRELKDIEGQAQSKELDTIVAEIMAGAEVLDGITVIAHKLEIPDMDFLKKLADVLRAKLKSFCFILCGVIAETRAAQFLAIVSADAVAKGVHAGNIVREAAKICGGGGGGKPDQAQAGAKDATNAVEALAKARQLVQL